MDGICFRLAFFQRGGARTVAVAIDGTKGAQDIATPGHVFPLRAKDGGVLVLLGKEEHIESQVRRFAAEDRGERPTGADWQGSSRTIGVGSQILASMGVHKMRLLSKPIKYHALSGYGLEVVEYVHD